MVVVGSFREDIPLVCSKEWSRTGFVREHISFAISQHFIPASQFDEISYNISEYVSRIMISTQTVKHRIRELVVFAIVFLSLSS